MNEYSQQLLTIDDHELAATQGGGLVDYIYQAGYYAYAAGQLAREYVTAAWDAHIQHCAETGCLPPS